MNIPFVGGEYTGRSTNVNAQVCQNLYLVNDNTGSKQKNYLMGTPGLTLFSSPVATGEVRGLIVMDDYLYAVIGSSMYQINSSGTATLLAGSLLTSTGPVWIKHNGTQIMVVDGQHGYIMSSSTVNEITDADFPIPSSLTYQDGYFIVTEEGTQKFYISTLYDGTSWDALDFASKEGFPDHVQACISANRELWIFGDMAYEVWYNSGDSTFPFDRISQANNKVGIIAPNSLAEFQGVIAWLDNNRVVRVSNAYNADRASTDHIDYQIAQYTTVSDAIGYWYQQEGHIFYVLTFPTEGKTWVFDATTKFWHTRASGTSDARHPANCYALFNNKHIVGHYSNGSLYYYNLSKYSDDGVLLRRIRTSSVLHKDQMRIFHHSLQVDFEAGTGLAVADPDFALGEDPQASLEWSDDGGHTWSNEHWVYTGKIGEYGQRAIWRRLGQSRARIYRLTLTDPVKWVVIGANLNFSGGK